MAGPFDALRFVSWPGPVPVEVPDYVDPPGDGTLVTCATLDLTQGTSSIDASRAPMIGEPFYLSFVIKQTAPNATMAFASAIHVQLPVGLTRADGMLPLRFAAVTQPGQPLTEYFGAAGLEGSTMTFDIVDISGVTAPVFEMIPGTQWQWLIPVIAQASGQFAVKASIDFVLAGAPNAHPSAINETIIGDPNAAIWKYYMKQPVVNGLNQLGFPFTPEYDLLWPWPSPEPEQQVEQGFATFNKGQRAVVQWTPSHGPYQIDQRIDIGYGYLADWAGAAIADAQTAFHRIEPEDAPEKYSPRFPAFYTTVTQTFKEAVMTWDSRTNLLSRDFTYPVDPTSAVKAGIYLAGDGWQSYVNGGEVAGTPNSGLGIYGIDCQLYYMPWVLFEFVFYQGGGWTEWSTSSSHITPPTYPNEIQGLALRLSPQGVPGALFGDSMSGIPAGNGGSGWSISYSGYFANIGWQAAMKDGGELVRPGQRLEAINISVSRT